MFIWNSLVKRFGGSSNLTNKLKALCSADMNRLSEAKLKEFISEMKEPKAEVEKTLCQYQKELQSRSQHSGTRKLKFIMILFYSQQQPSVQQWLFTHKLVYSLQKQTLMQSAMLPSLLEQYLSEIFSRMYFYLLRKLKSTPSIQTTISQVEQPRTLINKLYKLVNQLEFLFELRDLFHRMFSRYSDIGLIQEVFELVLDEANGMYEKFKGCFTGYLSGMGGTGGMGVGEENGKEVAEVVEINKRMYKKLRQLYFVTDLLAGEGTVMKKYNLAKMAEIPPEYARKMIRQKRINRYSGDLAKSAVVVSSNSSTAMINKGDTKINLMDSLSQRQSADEETEY